MIMILALLIIAGFLNSSLSLLTPRSKTFSFRSASALANFDYKSENKLPWIEEGYNTWQWRGNKINYLEVGGQTGDRKPPLLLIHGFGASAFHWRYNVPELARKYHVYAIDLLGFGLSDKPIQDYSADVWKDQVLDFIAEVMDTSNDAAVVAGNSLGGFTALFASADSRATRDNLIKGCILINAAGRFRSPDVDATKTEKPQWMQTIAAAFQRFVIGLSFIYTKQPARIAQVLRQVYPIDPTNVDDELVKSIQYPVSDE